MYKTSIKFLVVLGVVVLAITALSSCASLSSPKKPKSAVKIETTNEKSTERLLAQPKFRISKKTITAYNEALKHMRAKNYDTAIIEMQKVAKMDQRISGPWVNIGVAYQELGDSKRALLAFEKAITINPNNPYALNQLAILKRENGEFDEAEKLYMKALAAYPDYKNAHLNLAILCDVYLRKIGCALNHYQEYLDLSGGQDKQVIAWMSQLKKQGS